MTFGYHPCLSCKTHIDFKDKVIFDMLVPYRYLLNVTHNLEGWLYIFGLIIDGISLEIISILFVELLGLIGIFRHHDAKLVSFLPVHGLDLGYNLIALSERIWDPTCKSRILREIIFHKIFFFNNRVSFLEILQWSPGCLPILPFNDQFPPFCRLTRVFFSLFPVMYI